MNTLAINAVFAMLAAFTAIGTINKMSAKTDHTVRISVLMILVGMISYVVSIVTGLPDGYSDILMIGGITAFMLSTRRHPCGIPIAYSIKVAVIIEALTAIMVITQM